VVSADDPEFDAWLRDARRHHIEQLENRVLPVMEDALLDVLASNPTAHDVSHCDQLMAWCRDQRAALPRWRAQYDLKEEGSPE
jgi:hypothetical protein